VFTKYNIRILVDVVIVELSTQFEHIYFPDFAQFKDMLPLMQLKPRIGVITTNTPLINFSP